MSTKSASSPRRVLVIGCGGNGSWLAPVIGRILNINAPGSQLILVDGDNFEPKNAERQNFTKMGNKAKSVASDLYDALENVSVIPKGIWVVPEDASEADDGVGTTTASNLIKEDDIIFLCVDNFAARKLVYDAAQDLDNVVIMNGGNEDDGFGSTYLYVRENGEDLVDHPGVHHPEFVEPPDRNPGSMSCAERADLPSGTQVIATNVAVAATMAYDVRKLLFGDECDENTPDGYHRAGVLLTNEKMFHLDYGSSYTWARMNHELFSELCEINTEVAENSHGQVVDLVLEPANA
jgi:hypothetical protein